MSVPPRGGSGVRGTKVGVINEHKTNHAINANNDPVLGRFVIDLNHITDRSTTVSVIRFGP